MQIMFIQANNYDYTNNVYTVCIYRLVYIHKYFIYNIYRHIYIFKLKPKKNLNEFTIIRIFFCFFETFIMKLFRFRKLKILFTNFTYLLL